MVTSIYELDPSFDARVAEKVQQHSTALAKRIDRLFAGLMLVQWLACVVTVLVISPHTWIGRTPQFSQHVWFVIVGGGVLWSLPALFAWKYPGTVTSRMAIAVSQMLFSTLLIHISGGRIETHFHVFASLAFLAAYRDWRVLMVATAVVALDHFIRGVWWPQSVFGVSTASPFRWLEHAGWVLLTDLFLLFSIRWSLTEMNDSARQTTRIEFDAEEIIRAKDQAEAANRAKSEFLANMSHEIRTPLNGILGFTELLIRGADGGDEAERLDFLKTIRSSGKHLLQLLNDVLDISKIEAGQLQVEKIPFSPHQLLAEVISVLRVPARQKGVSLDYRWESGIPETIQTDPHRLKQLLMNLVSNAIKFTEEGSVLVVAKLDDTARQPVMRFEIRDTGIGILPEKLETIFRPFVQADTSVTRKYGGTGLGLAISYRIARSLGGDLSVSSQIGCGSVFTVTIDAGDLRGVAITKRPAAVAIGDVKKPAVTGSKPSLDGVRILLVDDGETNRKLISLFLTRNGAAVEMAENGALAVHATEQGEFDVILMDMQMPVMDGYTATRRLRENGYKSPIIALTAHAMKGDREKCEAVGCSGYLAKPVNIDELVRTVRDSLNLQKQPTNDGLAAAKHETGDDMRYETQVVRSTLPTDDPEIREVVREFIDSIDVRLDAMTAALESESYEELARLAHALKGSGGTAGYNCFTDPAGRIEQCAKARNPQDIGDALSEIEKLRKVLAV
jgi:signal transduction histidine kinase/CheY-like chemotaxis protein/HPt (histidine-containing phosphotransfer) domain-containing protein